MLKELFGEFCNRILEIKNKRNLKIPVSTSDQTEIIFRRGWLYHFTGETVLPAHKRAVQLANVFFLWMCYRKFLLTGYYDYFNAHMTRCLEDSQNYKLFINLLTLLATLRYSSKHLIWSSFLKIVVLLRLQKCGASCGNLFQVSAY